MGLLDEFDLKEKHNLKTDGPSGNKGEVLVFKNQYGSLSQEKLKKPESVLNNMSVDKDLSFKPSYSEEEMRSKDYKKGDSIGDMKTDRHLDFGRLFRVFDKEKISPLTNDELSLYTNDLNNLFYYLSMGKDFSMTEYNTLTINYDKIKPGFERRLENNIKELAKDRQKLDQFIMRTINRPVENITEVYVIGEIIEEYLKEVKGHSNETIPFNELEKFLDRINKFELLSDSIVKVANQFKFQGTRI